MQNERHLNRQIVTMLSLGLLFLGSLFYLVSVAIKSRDSMQNGQDSTQHLINTILDTSPTANLSNQ